jgi:hypothetical protein
MMRTLMALALVTTLAAGCDEKKDTAPAPVSGAAVVPTGAAVVPSGAAAAPSGTTVSGEATKPSGEAAKPSEKASAPKGGTTKAPPPITGGMPHGNPEDGTLKYNPPPAQNPPAKK